MRKKHAGFFWIAVVLFLVLAACTPAGTTSTLAANEPGSAAGTPDAAQNEAVTQPTADLSNTAGLCVGVDTAQLMAAGQTLYADKCAGCHGEQGEGSSDFPALSANANVTGEDVLALIQAYFAVDGHPKEVTADDLAAVLTYTRGAFGNTAPAVCPADIVIPVQ